MDSFIVEAADRTARNWKYAEPGPLLPGDARHKAMLSRVMLDTFNPYKPAIIAWPKLDRAAHARLMSLPIWDIAVQTEGRARLRILSYARSVEDQLLREALELMGFEEGRHKAALSHLVTAYGIELKPEPDYVEPRDPEWGFLVTGYSECIDSFFAFGLFDIAARSGYFPEALAETFEPVIQEEARHILFFVNWIAWHKANMPCWRRPWFFLKTLAVWSFLIRERIGLARDVGGGPSNANFTVSGGTSLAAGELDTLDLMNICLAENDRRLLRPVTVPRLVRLALAMARRLRRVRR